MDSRDIELALRKQKLQMRAEAQRADITRRLAGIDGALDRVDSLRDNLAWAKDKVPLLSVALLVVLAAKPRLALRLAKRAWVGWLLVRQARGGRLSALLPTAIPLLRGLLALIKRRLTSPMALRTLQLTHRFLGLSMLVLLVLHAGFVHQGYLTVTFLITMLVVVAGAVLNLLPGHRLPTWGQWTTALHIAAGCLLGALAVMHLYFVYTYTT